MNYTFEDLKNKTIIITGGSGFLGSQFVESFVDTGSYVVNLDKKINKKMFSYKKNLLNIECNITREDDVKKSLKKILKHFKKIDVLVNCAFSDYVPSNSKYKKFTFDNFNLDQWYSDLDVGLTGAFICSKIFGAEMNKNKRGNIINISSDLGIISPSKDL